MCKEKEHEYLSINDTEKLLLLKEKIQKNYSLMAITRDPIDRFLSSYLHLCVQYSFFNLIICIFLTILKYFIKNVIFKILKKVYLILSLKMQTVVSLNNIKIRFLNAFF